MGTNNFIEGGYRFKKGINVLCNTSPLISIITVCLNVEHQISNCINSVILQEYKNIEHIVIDGLSIDDTTKILKKFDSKLAYWRSEPDLGIYNAMNKAITLTQGKWILFLGADDELLNGFSEMATLLTDENCIYYTDVLFKNIKMGGRFNTYKLAKTNICHQAIFYPRRVFDKYQYDEKYTISADHYLNIKCWVDPEFKWIYNPKLVTHYYSGGISSLNKDLKFEKERIEIIRKYLGWPSYFRYIFRVLKQSFRK